MTVFPIWRGTAQIESAGPSRKRWLGAVAAALALIAMPQAIAQSAQEETVIVAFGDSLTAGYRLPPEQSFPAQLEKALRARGHDVSVINAGVSGDTAAAGLARLDWAVPPEADAVIVELGANDALRGIDPDKTRAALDTILSKLKQKGLPVLLAGMQAPRNMGPEYAQAFDAIYPELAERHGVLLYPFFLQDVAMQQTLNLDDGMHPNGKGVAKIVAGMLPKVEELIARAKTARG